jgi:hypothetical protein
MATAPKRSLASSGLSGPAQLDKDESELAVQAAIAAGRRVPPLIEGLSLGSCMMASMNTERCDPVELAALRESFASRPEAAAPAGWEEAPELDAS